LHIEPNTDAVLARDLRRQEAQYDAADQIEETWWNNLPRETRDTVEALIPDGTEISRRFWDARRWGRL